MTPLELIKWAGAFFTCALVVVISIALFISVKSIGKSTSAAEASTPHESEGL